MQGLGTLATWEVRNLKTFYSPINLTDSLLLTGSLIHNITSRLSHVLCGRCIIDCIPTVK